MAPNDALVAEKAVRVKGDERWDYYNHWEQDKDI